MTMRTLVGRIGRVLRLGIMTTARAGATDGSVWTGWAGPAAHARGGAARRLAAGPLRGSAGQWARSLRHGRIAALRAEIAALSIWRIRLPADPLILIDELWRRWGCSAANRLADRAGLYRRLAVALALLPIPLSLEAVALAGADGPFTVRAAGYLALAGACGWLAADLVRAASMLDRRARPAPSAVAVLVCLGLLASLRPADMIDGRSLSAIAGPAVLAMMSAFALLVLAERVDDRLVGMVGRMALVAGAAALGLVELTAALQAIRAAPETRLHAAGLGGIGSLLVLTAYFEGKVLVRGWALARTVGRL